MIDGTMSSPSAHLLLEVGDRSWPLHDGDVIGRLGTVGGDTLRQYDVLSRQHLRVEHTAGRWQVVLMPNVGNETLCNGRDMSPGVAVVIAEPCEIQVVTLTLRLMLVKPSVHEEHPAALLTLDDQLCVAWRNAMAATLLGNDLPPGTDFLPLIETGAAMQLRRVLTALRDGSALEECEAALHPGGGTPWIALRATRSGDRVLLALREITRERQQRETVKQAASRLESKVGALTVLLTAKAFADGDLAAALPLLVEDAAALLDDTEVSAWLPKPVISRAPDGPLKFTCWAIAGTPQASTGTGAEFKEVPPRGEVPPAKLAALRGEGLLRENAVSAWLEPLDQHGLLVFQRTDTARVWTEPDARLMGLAAALGRQLFANVQRGEVLETLRTREANLSAELADAAQYVERRLPAVLTKGHAQVDWVYKPCGRLGGDTFQYEWLDGERFAISIVDVMGHGSKAALHALSLSQTLKLLLARGAGDDPAAWLTALNREFPMKENQDLLWTMWCGLYDSTSHTLRHASGGHPPALLCQEGKVESLATGGPVLGAMEEAEYRSASTILRGTAKLFLFTDGAYEFPLANGETGTLEDFTSAVQDAARMEGGECDYLKTRAAALCAEAGFPDDFTVVRATFTR